LGFIYLFIVQSVIVLSPYLTTLDTSGCLYDTFSMYCIAISVPRVSSQYPVSIGMHLLL